MKECRYIELFAGVGGFHVGLDRADKDFFKCVMANQWEPGAKDQFAADIYRKRFPNDLLINDDVNNIKGDDYDVDLLMGGFPCLSGNTLVLTSDGYKYITEVKEGDMVLGHDNQYHKVNKFMNQGIKQTYKIKASGFDTIEATGNHRFLVREKIQRSTRVKGKPVYIKSFSQPEWKSVDDLKDCYKDYYMGSAINQNSIIPEWRGLTINKNQFVSETHCNLDMTDENLWYIVGRFLGDGWLNKQTKKGNLRYRYKGIIICCAKDEIDEFISKISDKYNCTIVEERTVYKLHFSNIELAHFCEQFYNSDEHTARTKRLPGFVFDLPINLLEQLLKGYQDSDGCVTGIYNQFTSVSKELLYGIAHCIEKVYHKPTLLSICRMPEQTIIEGRLVNQNNFYQLQYRHSEPKHSTYFYEDGYIWYPISKIEEYIEQPVYDIEVDESHSFIANHCITHNCQDYSVAKSKSSSMGIEGKKGVLWWQVIRLITEMKSKPKFLLFENVDRMLISPAKQRGRDFSLIVESLIKFGYDLEWRVINAADYGMPQRRKRIFIFAFLHGTFDVKSADDWLFRDGVLAKAFPVKQNYETGLWGLDSRELESDLVRLSNYFNKGNTVQNPFDNGGVALNGLVYTYKLVPDYKGPKTTLGDILVKGDDRNLITPDYYINEFDLEQWRYLKGQKVIPRVSKDGHEYNYSEGAMPFPDPLDKPARTLITSEVSNTPSRFTHVILDPVDGRYRRLLPIELERIQMFPDNHTDGTTDKKRGFLMGNALVCGIVEKIGKELKNRIWTEDQ